MVWIIVFIAVVVLGIAWIASQSRLGGMPPVVDDRPGPDLPDAELTGDDLRGVRFAVTTRGYSMEQVDAMIDRLADQLDGTPYNPQDAFEAWLNETDESPEDQADADDEQPDDGVETEQQPEGAPATEPPDEQSQEAYPVAQAPAPVVQHPAALPQAEQAEGVAKLGG